MKEGDYGEKDEYWCKGCYQESILEAAKLQSILVQKEKDLLAMSEENKIMKEELKAKKAEKEENEKTSKIMEKERKQLKEEKETLEKEKKRNLEVITTLNKKMKMKQMKQRSVKITGRKLPYSKLDSPREKSETIVCIEP